MPAFRGLRPFALLYTQSTLRLNGPKNVATYRQGETFRIPVEID